MLRLMLSCAVCTAAVGCAAGNPTTHAHHGYVSDSSEVIVRSMAAEADAAEKSGATTYALGAESAVQPAAPAAYASDKPLGLEYALEPTAEPAAAEDGDKSLHKNRFTIKGGLYSAEDADDLDDGWLINVAWSRYFTALFAAELELGYFSADGSNSTDVWGIPVMVNGRLNLPVWVIDLYGGLGVGGFYWDAEAGNVIDDSGWAWGGNGFLGASINVADAISLGLEGKYYVSEEIDDLGDTRLDAFALLLTLGFAR